MRKRWRGASRIANDPAFARTRDKGAEFGRTGKAGKMLRTAFRSLLQNTAASKMVSRLTADFVKGIQADALPVFCPAGGKTADLFSRAKPLTPFRRLKGTSFKIPHSI